MKIDLNKENGVFFLSKGPAADHVWFSVFLIIVGLGGLALFLTGDPLADPDLKMAGIFGPISAVSGVLLWLNGYWKFTLNFNNTSTFRHGLFSWTLTPECIDSAYVSAETVYGRRGNPTMYELALVLRVDHPDNFKKKIKDGRCVVFYHRREGKDRTYHKIWEPLHDIAVSINSGKKAKTM